MYTLSIIFSSLMTFYFVFPLLFFLMFFSFLTSRKMNDTTYLLWNKTVFSQLEDFLLNFKENYEWLHVRVSLSFKDPLGLILSLQTLNYTIVITFVILHWRYSQSFNCKATKNQVCQFLGLCWCIMQNPQGKNHPKNKQFHFNLIKEQIKFFKELIPLSNNLH